MGSSLAGTGSGGGFRSFGRGQGMGLGLAGSGSGGTALRLLDANPLLFERVQEALRCNGFASGRL